MTSERLKGELARISRLVDPEAHDRRTEDRMIGPALEKAGKLVRDAFEGLDEFTLVNQEEQSHVDFAVICGPNMTPVVTIRVAAGSGHITMGALALPGSPFKMEVAPQRTVAFEGLADDWVEANIAEIMASLNKLEKN